MTTTGLVRLLDPHTINQIAAGEVVERPASVVKELVENAIDAGATRIEVELRDAGRTLIRVTDNGGGMDAADAAAAMQRHATSKIRIAEDLTSVSTLGFRGEALPSIASVSRMTLATATSPGVRTVIAAEGGAVRQSVGDPGDRGTEVTVEDLFYNTPARLKFLKSDGSELAACLEHVARYAMGYPTIAFRATHQGQEALATTGSGDLLTTLAEVWGRDLAKTLAEVDGGSGSLVVRGFVSPPHLTRPTRAYQYVYVNGRPVRSRTLTAALDQAYRDLTPERRYPVLLLYLEAPPDRLDVNVSPTKSEVKFQHEGQAFDAIRSAIREGLRTHGMIPDAAGMAAVAATNFALKDHRGFGTSFEAQAPILQGLGGLGEGTPAMAAVSLPSTSDVHDPFAGPVRTERFPYADLLDGLRVIGQAYDTFVIAETRSGIVIVDQHVAHERILYEYLCGLKGDSPIERQPLLTPETLHLDKRASVLLRERLGELSAVGFDLEPFGGESFLVRTFPAALRGRSPMKALKDLVDELVDATVVRRLSPTREQIWITSACKMAVKAGDPLSHAEMEKLLVDLASTENPYLCPHGRPITIRLSADDLLRKFKRI